MNNIMDKFIYVTSGFFSEWCVKMKIKLPKRFYNVSKNNEEYKKWLKSEEYKFGSKIQKINDNCWWNSLEEDVQKYWLDKYKTKEKVFSISHSKQNTEYSCNKYRIITSYKEYKNICI
jgi:hypothetical protein